MSRSHKYMYWIIEAFPEPDVGVYIYNTWEAEIGGSLKVANLGYIVNSRPMSATQKKNGVREMKPFTLNGLHVV